MNIHPLLVHFPIALLTIYSLFELLRFKKLLDKAYWFYLKAGLVIVGSLSSVATYLSGDAIEGMFRDFPEQAHLVEVHSSFALASCLIFGVIAISYLIQWLSREGIKHESSFWKQLVSLTDRFVRSPLIAALALIGLACITITGGLGGALVYGSDIDPFVSFIYKLLIK